MTKNTLKSNGYKYLFYDYNRGDHVLYEIATGNVERWAGHRTHGIGTMHYKNTELEFCSSYNDTEKLQLINGMRRIQNFGEQHPDFNSTMMNVYRKYISK